MGKTRHKTLTPEDEALWHSVTADTVPLARRNPPPSQAVVVRPDTAVSPCLGTPAPKPAVPVKPRGRAMKNSIGVDLANHTPGKVGRGEPGFDRRTAQRMKSGTRAPEARLDLHGKTKEQAHTALKGFITRSRAQGLRFVLVITGKGERRRGDEPLMGSAGDNRGVLRQAVPKWLASAPLADGITSVFEAHIRHGGAGALYVCLKKRR